MSFWKKKDNLIISAAVAFFLVGLAFWPNLCSLRSALNAAPSITQIEIIEESGNKVTLEKYRGKPVIVNFWATWCPVCVRNMASFNEFAQSFQAQGGKVIAISEDSSLAEAKAYIARNDYAALPAHLDNNGALMTAYGVQGLPTSVFIDANGNEVDRIVGGVDWSDPAVRNMVANGLGIRVN